MPTAPQPSKTNAFMVKFTPQEGYELKTPQLPYETHILGGSDSYVGVGNYRKYCWQANEGVGYDHGNRRLRIVNDPNLGSIFDKGYKIRVLKIVFNDTLGDAPFSKNPYQ